MTRFILLAGCIELLFLGYWVSDAHRVLSLKTNTETERLLLSQSDLLAQQVDLQKVNAPLFQFNNLDLDPAFSFQVVSTNGIVAWDSKEPKRLQKQIFDHHPLFDEAVKSTETHKNVIFENSQTGESFLGAFTKVGNAYLVFAAVSTREVNLSTIRTLERFIFIALFFSGLFLILTVLFFQNLIGRLIRRQENQEAKDLAPLSKRDLHDAHYKISTAGNLCNVFQTDQEVVFFAINAGEDQSESSASLAASVSGFIEGIFSAPEKPTFSFLALALFPLVKERNGRIFLAHYSIAEKKLQYFGTAQSEAWGVKNDQPLQILISSEEAIQELTLEENQTIFLHTEGLLHCVNQNQEAYGKMRAKENILASVKASPGLSSQRDHLLEEIAPFHQNQIFRDEISFLFFRDKNTAVKNE